jgi:hypothetical protein
MSERSPNGEQLDGGIRSDAVDGVGAGPGLLADEVVGCVGRIEVPTRGPAGAGEVTVRVRGGRESYLAWSAEPLDCQTPVLVIGLRSARTVEVVPWSEHLLGVVTD